MKKERLEVVTGTDSYMGSTAKVVCLVGEETGDVFLNLGAANSRNERKANWIAHCINVQLERDLQL